MAIFDVDIPDIRVGRDDERGEETNSPSREADRSGVA
jgi:hypothetical protein